MSGRRSGTGRRGVAPRAIPTHRAIRVLPLLLGVLLLHGIGTAALAHAAVTAPGHHPAAHPVVGHAAGHTARADHDGHADHADLTGRAGHTGHARHAHRDDHGAAHPFTAVPRAPGHPSVAGGAADVREPCGHAERAEVTCHAAGVALAPAPPFPTGSIPVPVLAAAPPAVRPCASLGRRAPPSLSELQLLRV